MKARLLAMVSLLALLASLACAQVGASITLTGSMTVGEGGAARVVGRVLNTASGPLGTIGVNFDTGNLRSARLLQVDDFFANFFTGAVSGPGVISVIKDGRLSLRTGHCVFMVDDLDLMDPLQPDQFFFHFTDDRTGEVIVRHGLMTNGDITIFLP